jgi:glycosyltransferase involved in cell wall biosynthesis
MSGMKILHIITNFVMGGAEMMLYKLLSRADRTRVQASVLSLVDVGPVGERARDLGVPVRSLGLRRDLSASLAIPRLARWIRRERPDVVQTWMYHADLIGGVAARLAGGVPVAWNIRHSDLDPRDSRRTTIWTARACAHLSRKIPARIVCCSDSAFRVHSDLGYDAARMVVIPNGFDVKRFKPDPIARRGLREELRLADDTPLIGQIGRFDPQKDHHNFIRAAALLRATHPVARFVLCGDALTRENSQVRDWLDEAGLGSGVHLLGRREDVARVHAALDILTLSSAFGEGFPNVVGEAMASGVPCVVTDVGDSAMIVGDTGRVVPARDPGALADAWRWMLGLGPEGRARLGEAARERVVRNFELDSIVTRYQSFHEQMAEDYRARRSR